MFWAAPVARGQELVAQPTSFTVLLDFAALRNPAIPRPLLPIWIESVQIPPASIAAPATDSTISGLLEVPQSPHTVVRVRLRSIPGLNDRVYLRLFFDDRADAHPVITAWSDTNGCQFTSQPLGAGLDLPASEALSIPTQNANYLEIDVPGDGSNIRQALLTALKTSTVETAIDFSAPPSVSATNAVVDPFGNTPSQPVTENDTYLFGRVRATLEPGVIKLSPPNAVAQSGTAEQQTLVSFEFNLESAPLLAFVALDILNADPLAPLQAWVNDKAVGPLVPQFPDLADPAYHGLAQSLQPMRFCYAGWLHGQLIIRGSALRAGQNTITLQLPADASPAAIRSIELQLKHNWKALDYTLAP